mmetsp:Transcript_28050/g.36679  ORF Transcript_28050/g.36679 Transcript_28050/m.36679 type:complete len:218 (+) Transcript_28050:143-796(+)
MSKSVAAASGHALWAKMPKANAELFALTYGSLVTELIRDYDSIDDINEQLEKMGYSIGVRCVDEFLAKSEQHGMTVPTCQNLKDTAEVVAKTGFRMFLGISCDVTMAPDGNAFSLFMYENPLSLFVELPKTTETLSDSTGAAGGGRGGAAAGGPKQWKDLKYSNLYCGILRGSLEQINLRVSCEYVRDVLQGEEVNEIRVTLREVLQDGAGDDYKEE